MGFWNKKETLSISQISINGETAQSTENVVEPEVEQPVETVEQPKPKMIWVDGFKGMNKDMQCMKGFQYEIGKEYKYDGDIDLCHAGFHACKNLSDVFRYYNFNGSNRFFKIKALVPEDYDKDFGKRLEYHVYGYSVEDSKYVTSDIKIESECTYEDMKTYVDKYFPMIESAEEYEQIANYKLFSKKKFIDNMQSIGFSEAFAIIISNNILTRIYKQCLDFAKALVAENISKDLQVYVLLDFVKKYSNDAEMQTRNYR